MRNQKAFQFVSPIFLLAYLVSWGLAFQAPAAEPAKTSRDWAKAVKKPGLPNLHKVNDRLYRGAQPEETGYEELAKMGIKTVICLRETDPDREAIKRVKLECIHIPVKTWNPTKDQVVQFLKAATDKRKQPIYVHCRHGSDRTGTMCAIYRVAVESWSKEDAIREMTKGDFGFHSLWTNLIRFIQKLDIDALKKKAGLEEKNGQGQK
ncbi:MAG: dual specificity protein phosphatase family protein [Pirellulales bacterium]|nr:dual specificity protein phosphatase family protein [Pirellulales bacterium]